MCIQTGLRGNVTEKVCKQTNSHLMGEQQQMFLILGISSLTEFVSVVTNFLGMTKAMHITCWNCRKCGHFAAVCRNKLIHELNTTPPTSGSSILVNQPNETVNCTYVENLLWINHQENTQSMCG